MYKGRRLTKSGCSREPPYALRVQGKVAAVAQPAGMDVLRLRRSPGIHERVDKGLALDEARRSTDAGAGVQPVSVD